MLIGDVKTGKPLCKRAIAFESSASIKLSRRVTPEEKHRLELEAERRRLAGEPRIDRAVATHQVELDFSARAREALKKTLAQMAPELKLVTR